jgi:transposase
MEKKSQKQHRKFDAQFKLEAVNQVNKGRSVPSVSKALGISDSLLYGWCKQANSFATEKPSELDGLRKLVRQLETERDILKKALAIFSRVN